MILFNTSINWSSLTDKVGSKMILLMLLFLISFYIYYAVDPLDTNIFAFNAETASLEI